MRPAPLANSIDTPVDSASPPRRLLGPLIISLAILLITLPSLSAIAIPHAQGATPTITLSHYINGPNDTENISGSGFTPGGSVAVAITNSVAHGQQLATLSVDASGAISGTFVLPLSIDASSPNTISVTDNANATLSAQTVITGAAVRPVLFVTPTNGAPGTLLTDVHGLGFGHSGPLASHRADSITISVGNIPITTVQTGPVGNFDPFVLQLPANVPDGQVLLTARGQVTGIGQNDSASQVLTILGLTSLVATPSPAGPGAIMAISGSGYLAGENVNVVATLPGTNGQTTSQTLSAVANAQGAISGVNLTVPTTAPRTGQVVLLATGQSSGHAAGTIVSLQGVRGLTVTPVTGPPGTHIVAVATGFAPAERVTFILTGAAQQVSADTTGVATATLTAAPTLLTGLHAITALGALGGAGDQVAGTFTVGIAPHAAITASQNIVMPGARVLITGSGYANSEPVAVTLNAQPVPTVPATPMTDATGTFTAAITVPHLAATGVYSLTARGVTSLAAGSIPLQVNLPVVSRWYFAEGFTGQGPSVVFSETLHMVNPTDQIAQAKITYFFAVGAAQVLTQTIQPHSALIEDVNKDVGSNKIVSALVESDQPIATLRLIARQTALGAVLDSSASSGQSTPATDWIFAEGYTGATFQEYLTIQNPGAITTTVSIGLHPTSGSVVAQPVTTTIAPFSRYTLNVRSALANRSLSLTVHATQPVVAERVLYWGDGAGSAKFGSDAKPGVAAPSSSWSFAVASTAHNDESYITMYNPASMTATVTATLLGASNVVATQAVTISPMTRATLALKGLIRTPSGVAGVTLSSSLPIAAEEAQYVGGSPNIGQHPGLALQGQNPATTWLLPGGWTQAATETVYLLNPGPKPTNVLGIVYATDGSSYAQTYTLPAHAVVAVPVAGIRGLPAGAHGSLWSDPDNVGFVVAQVVTSFDGKLAWGDSGTH